MRGKLIAGLCTAAVSVVVVAPAEAAKWRGKTSAGRLAAVHTGADGLVSMVRIKYRVVCSDNKVLNTGVVFLPTLDHSTPSAFRDGGVFRWRIKGGERARARVSVDGGLRRSGRWTGNFSIRVRITKRGRYVATCRVPHLGWKASPVT